MPKLPGPGLSAADELAKLAELRDGGILSEKEFQDQKRALLAANRIRLARVVPPQASPMRIVGIAAAVALVVAALFLIPKSSPAPSTLITQLAGSPVKATTVEQRAVAWAMSQIGSTAFGTQQDGLCLTLVTEAYQSPHGGNFPIEHLTNYGIFNKNTYPEQVWNDGFHGGQVGYAPSVPPYGALVFFNASGSHSGQVDYSHVTIMGANGQMISGPDVVPHPNNTVHSETLSQVQHAHPWNSYVGWWVPDGQQSGTPLTATPPVASAPVPATPTPTTSQPSSTAPERSSTPTPVASGSATPLPGASPLPTPTATPTATPAPPPTTYPETAGGLAHTWSDYLNAGGYEGPSVAAYQTVQIACKVTGMPVADGNTWWYRIAQSPWSNSYYVSADAFYNNGATSGPLTGTPFVDPRVPNC